PDDKIVISGFRLDATLGYEVEIIRYNPDGTRDTTFGRSGITVVNVNSFKTGANDLAIQDDGKMVVACTYGDEDFCVIRINSDGSPDSSFDDNGIVITNVAGASDACMLVGIQSDGKIVAGGDASSDFAAVRYLDDGSIDTSFNHTGIALAKF